MESSLVNELTENIKTPFNYDDQQHQCNDNSKQKFINDDRVKSAIESGSKKGDFIKKGFIPNLREKIERNQAEKEKEQNILLERNSPVISPSCLSPDKSKPSPQIKNFFTRSSNSSQSEERLENGLPIQSERIISASRQIERGLAKLMIKMNAETHRSLEPIMLINDNKNLSGHKSDHKNGFKNVLTKVMKPEKQNKLTCNQGGDQKSQTVLQNLEKGQKYLMNKQLSNKHYNLADLSNLLKSRNLIEISKTDQLMLNIGFLKTICNLEKNENAMKYYENSSKENLEYYIKTAIFERDKLEKIVSKLNDFIVNAGNQFQQHNIELVSEKQIGKKHSLPVINDKTKSQQNIHANLDKRRFKQNSCISLTRLNQQNIESKETKKSTKDYTYYPNENNLNSPKLDSSIFCKIQGLNKSKKNKASAISSKYHSDSSRQHFFENNFKAKKITATIDNYVDVLDNLPQFSNSMKSLKNRIDEYSNFEQKQTSESTKNMIIKKNLREQHFKSFQYPGANPIETPNAKKIKTTIKNNCTSLSNNLYSPKLNEDVDGWNFVLPRKQPRLISAVNSDKNLKPKQIYYSQNDVHQDLRRYTENNSEIINTNKPYYKVSLENIMEENCGKKHLNKVRIL